MRQPGGTIFGLVISLFFLPLASLQSTGPGSRPTPSQGAASTPPPRTGSLPQARSPSQPLTQPASLPVTNPPSHSRTAAGSSPPTMVRTNIPPMTTANMNDTDINATAQTPQAPPTNCHRGFWGSWCQYHCNCNKQPCNRTGACLCGPCFTGPTCNDTSDGGRQCVQDIFNARKPADVKNVLERVGRPPRTLPQPDRVALFAGFAKTSVNNIGDTKYEVIPKPGGKELIQLKAVIADKSAREVVCTAVKDGGIGATCIEHSAERTIYLNKPSDLNEE